jgi:hypothetical protein
MHHPHPMPGPVDDPAPGPEDDPNRPQPIRDPPEPEHKPNPVFAARPRG